MALRDKPSSLSQAVNADPINTQGKPLAIPRQKIESSRLSLYVDKALRSVVSEFI
jgi:stage V sporulation protein SpoVS